MAISRKTLAITVGLALSVLATSAPAALAQALSATVIKPQAKQGGSPLGLQVAKPCAHWKKLYFETGHYRYKAYYLSCMRRKFQ